MAEHDTFPMPAHGFTCFHCGETFTTPGAARNHFGFDPSYDPACRIKIGAERGLVMALRKAEADLEEMSHLLHDESSEAYRLYAAQGTRHRAQIMAVEEAGYEKGLADGRALNDDLIERMKNYIRQTKEFQCGGLMHDGGVALVSEAKAALARAKGGEG